MRRSGDRDDFFGFRTFIPTGHRRNSFRAIPPFERMESLVAGFAGLGLGLTTALQAKSRIHGVSAIATHKPRHGESAERVQRRRSTSNDIKAHGVSKKASQCTRRRFKQPTPAGYKRFSQIRAEKASILPFRHELSGDRRGSSFALKGSSRIPGRRCACNTVDRFRLVGVKGVKLECLRLGGRWYTSWQSISRFIGKLNDIPASDRSGESHISASGNAEAEKKLDRFGL